MGDNNYSTNWVWCLSSDLRQSAEWLGKKSRNSSVTGLKTLPSVRLNSMSRIIVVGHGNPGSTHINPVEGAMDATKFTTFLRRVLLEKLNCNKVKRISFHMCYGARAANQGKVYSSFVYNFARMCDFAEEVTGRTERTQMVNWDSEERPGVFDVYARKVVNSQGVFTHRLTGGKILFKPRGGTPEEPINPAAFIHNYD